MAKPDIIVIGASAGGVYALQELVASLPADFKTPIFIVQHVSASTPSMMPQIFSHAGPLRAVHPEDGEPIRPGMIYLAPPNHHLLVEADRVLVRKGPKENRFRPSVDALFRSAAYTFGPRVIAVVLTGLLNDGTSGMWSVKRLGGIGIIQDPQDAQYASMPESVLEYVDVDHIVPLAEVGPLLCQLTDKDMPEASEIPNEDRSRMELEVGIAAEKNAFEMGVLNLGEMSPVTCPDCSGVLVKFREGNLIRYRCHTGHAYTSGALLAEVTKTVEDTLWSSVRGLEEAIILLDQSGQVFTEAGDLETAEKFFSKAKETRRRSEKLHEFIFQQEQYNDDGKSLAPQEMPGF